jgi:hypothetical protein
MSCWKRARVECAKFSTAKWTHQKAYRCIIFCKTVLFRKSKMSGSDQASTDALLVPTPECSPVGSQLDVMSSERDACETLSLFFLDTEHHDGDYRYMARRLKELGLSWDRIEFLLFHKVAPVCLPCPWFCGSWMFLPWAYWDKESVDRMIAYQATYCAFNRLLARGFIGRGLKTVKRYFNELP